MSPMLEDISAFLYILLWELKIYGKLEKMFPDLQIKMVLLLTDYPPAMLIQIDKGDFKIEILEDIKDSKDLDNVECDTYMALPIEMLYGGADKILQGIADKKVKINNYKILEILGKVMSVR
ncbi:MAG: hypothetical protein ACTSUT_07780 [Promethearchaeota archaeon]